MFYYNILKRVIVKRGNRLFVIIAPILILIFTFVFISPQIGFTLFPASDQCVITGSIETKSGSDKKVLVKHLYFLDATLSPIPELKVYYVTLS